MKLLVLGSTGLLGSAIVAEATGREFDVIGAARSGADIQLDIRSECDVHALLQGIRPDAIFNCAAVTDIGQCETDPGLAYHVNARPAAWLAHWSREKQKPFVQISTDHFFPDGGPKPHAEGDDITLVNEYARTKYASEAFALISPHALVLRTSMIGIRGWPKPTFAEWAIGSIEASETIELYEDAFTSSLDSGTCAEAALDLLTQGATGLFNLGSRDVYSKSALIRELARQLRRELNRPASGSVAALQPRRAASLGLDVRAAQRRLAFELPDLEEVVARVLNQYEKVRVQ